MTESIDGSRFVVGIDLGTTNSALAFLDRAAAEPRIEVLAIPQLVAAGTVEAHTLLPSALYLPREHEFEVAQRVLPWGDASGAVVGRFAVARAADTPEQVVLSAKSWLSHAAVDRRAPLLPVTAGDGGTRVSPLEAQQAILAHLRAAWDHEKAAADPKARLADQEVVLTVPASFDAEARELTLEAARAAGLPDPLLLEEPQAAVHAWIEERGDAWRDEVEAGDTLLVCDIGGGTTDFSLVEATDEDGRLVLARVAVGDHLLLGGDNMDLALAFDVRARLAAEGSKLDARQVQALVAACRASKEKLLAVDAPDSLPLVILGRSRKLVGGTIRTDLARADAERLLVDGFFPEVPGDAAPEAAGSAGLSELGLPFVADAAISRHLAAFLRTHGRDGAKRPRRVLYNGGVMTAASLAGRAAEQLARWAADDGVAPPQRLEAEDLHHAVARGAVAFGRARHGEGIRIRGGSARSYYLGIASSMPAVPGFAPPVRGLCVVPFGMEEGTEVAVPGASLGLLVGQTATFRLFASSSRPDDALGAVLDEFETEELDELSPLAVRLEGEPGERSRVSLEVHLTAIGTMEIWCVSEAGERHRLVFGLREAAA